MKSRRHLLAKSGWALVLGLGSCYGADNFRSEEENYQRLFQQWQTIIRAALEKGQSVLTFVEGPKRKRLAASADLHLALLREKLVNDPLVCLVLSGNKKLAAPQNIAQYGIILEATSPDQQRRWLRLLDHKLQVEFKDK